MLLDLVNPLRRTALGCHNQIEAEVWFTLVGNNVLHHGCNRGHRLTQALFIAEDATLVAILKQMQKLADSS